MSSRKIYHPPRLFDDLYGALVQVLLARNFAATDIAFAQCQKDVTDLGSERLALDSLEAQYRQSQARFSIAQHERYERYSQLLNAAQGIYRSDSVMLAALDKFRRRLGRRGVETETPPESSISKAA